MARSLLVVLKINLSRPSHPNISFDLIMITVPSKVNWQ